MNALIRQTRIIRLKSIIHRPHVGLLGTVRKFEFHQIFTERQKCWKRQLPLYRTLVDTSQSATPTNEQRIFPENTDIPLYFLNMYYLNEYERERVASQITATLVQDVGWNASFACPETGKQYSSGDFVHKENAGKDDQGLWRFKKKASAVHAVAARVLDCIQYEINGIKEPRLCAEDPWVQPPLRASALGANFDDDVDDEDIEVEESSILESINLEETESDQTILETPPIDEYILRPVEVPTTPPFQKLVDAAKAQETVSLQTGTHSGSPTWHPAIPCGLQRKDVEDTKQVLSEVNAWVKFLSDDDNVPVHENIHRVVLPHTSNNNLSAVSVGGLLLSRLAEANRNLPPRYTGLGVTQAATKILDTMWEHGETPSADCYASYLLCLEGTPEENVALATEIVAAMKEGTEWKGRQLPQANRNVINSLIQCHAALGGRNGRFSGVEDGFTPDKESFMSLLSSEAFFVSNTTRAKSECIQVNQFDFNFAFQCISRMKELAETDESMAPDSQVYNAPLRWSGFPARPGSKAIPFDRYDRQISQRSTMVLQTHSMDKWRQFVISEGMDSIQTHEALIQAWCRVRNEKGLSEAQSILDDLIDSDNSEVRLISALPLFACALQVGGQASADRVYGLYTKLLDASKERPSLLPDGRVILAMLMTHCESQVEVVEGSMVGGASLDPSLSSRLFTNAERCSACLDEYFERFLKYQADPNESPVFLYAEAMMLGMRLWTDLLLVTNSAAEREQAYKRIHGIMDECDRILEALGGKENFRFPSLQASHLLEYYDGMFESFVYGSTCAQDEKSELEALSVALPWIDRSLRRLSEIQDVRKLDKDFDEDSDPTFKRTNRIFYPDNFVFIFDKSSIDRISVRRAFYHTLRLFRLREIGPHWTTEDGQVMQCLTLMRYITKQSYDESRSKTMLEAIDQVANSILRRKPVETNPSRMSKQMNPRSKGKRRIARKNYGQRHQARQKKRQTA